MKTIGEHSLRNKYVSTQSQTLELDSDLGIKRVEKHVVRAEPLGGVDSCYEEGILWALVDVNVQNLDKLLFNSSYRCMKHFLD